MAVETLAERAARGARELGPAFVALVDELSAGVHWGPAWRAIQLGTTPAVANALLRGESVPLDRLDLESVKRFGLSRRAA